MIYVVTITDAYQCVLILVLFLTCGKMVFPFLLQLHVFMQLAFASEM